MEEIHNILGYEDSLKIIQRKDAFSFSIDSTILSFFAKIKRGTGKIMDMGCGNGSICLFMSLFTKNQIIGVDIQKDMVDMARRSVKLNHLENQITILEKDIKGISKEFNQSEFGMVISNPPYFTKDETEILNKNDYLTISRHEVLITMEDIIKESRSLLKDGGSLVMIQRCERLEETIILLNKYGLNLKRIRFVYPKPDKEAYVFMFEAVKKASPHGLKVMEPLYIYKDNNDYSDEIISYFHYGENKDEKNKWI